MSSLLALTVYCVLILLASLAGGSIPQIARLTHTRMQVATSFVAGLMLGVGLLHLLPHAWEKLQSIDQAVWWLLGGFLVMFFIQRFFQYHHHEMPSDETRDHDDDHHDHHHAHHHNHGTEEQPSNAHAHHHHAGSDENHSPAPGQKALALTWGGAAFGLTIHTLIDGIALAASVSIQGHENESAWLLGFSTFLVIILHKPFDAMAITTLMAAGGWSRLARNLVNALFALAIPVGVILFWLIGIQSEQFVGAALAFAAGTFLCISSSDLLPELQFHSHDRVKLSTALLVGLALAVLIGAFETAGHDEKHTPGVPHASVMSRDGP